MPSRSVIHRKAEEYKTRANNTISSWYQELIAAHDYGRLSDEEFKRIKKQFLTTGRTVDYVFTINLADDYVAVLTEYLTPDPQIVTSTRAHHSMEGLDCLHETDITTVDDPEPHKTHTCLELGIVPPIIECANEVDQTKIQSVMRAMERPEPRIGPTFHYTHTMNMKVECWNSRFRPLSNINSLRSSIVRRSFSDRVGRLNSYSDFDVSPKFSITPSGQKLQISPDLCYNRFATFGNFAFKDYSATMFGKLESVIKFELGLCINTSYGTLSIQEPEKLVALVRDNLPQEYADHPFKAVAKFSEYVSFRPGLASRVLTFSPLIVFYDSTESEFLELNALHVINVRYKECSWFDGMSRCH